MVLECFEIMLESRCFGSDKWCEIEEECFS